MLLLNRYLLGDVNQICIQVMNSHVVGFWHLRWLVKIRADINLQPSRLVRPRTDTKLGPNRLVRPRTDVKLWPSALVRTRTDIKLQPIGLVIQGLIQLRANIQTNLFKLSFGHFLYGLL